MTDPLMIVRTQQPWVLRDVLQSDIEISRARADTPDAEGCPIRIADHAPPGSERAAVVDVLLQELEGYMTAVLGDANAAHDKAQLLLPHFFNGTFGLCIADPSTGADIARKELLQEQLVALASDTHTPLDARVDRQALLALIDDYARASMPFSPAEYDRRSRKRWVDDLRRELDEKS